jgi:hypothetical protein
MPKAPSRLSNRHKCQWNKQGTGSNSREKISSAFEGTSRKYTGPVRKQLLPVKVPDSRQNAGPGQSLRQTLLSPLGSSSSSTKMDMHTARCYPFPRRLQGSGNPNVHTNPIVADACVCDSPHHLQLAKAFLQDGTCIKCVRRPFDNVLQYVVQDEAYLINKTDYKIGEVVLLGWQVLCLLPLTQVLVRSSSKLW